MRLSMAPADFLSAIQFEAPLFKDSTLVRHPTNGGLYVTVPHQCGTVVNGGGLRPVAVSLERFREQTAFLLAYLSRASTRDRRA